MRFEILRSIHCIMRIPTLVEMVIGGSDLEGNLYYPHILIQCNIVMPFVFSPGATDYLSNSMVRGLGSKYVGKGSFDDHRNDQVRRNENRGSLQSLWVFNSLGRLQPRNPTR